MQHSPPQAQRRLHARNHFSRGHLPLDAACHMLRGDQFAHDHDFWEAVLILGGSGTHCSVQGEQPLRSGDVFLLRPGVWHRYRACDSLIVYNCCFATELVRRELASLLREPALNYLLFTGPLAAGARGMMTLHLEDNERVFCNMALNAIHNADTVPDRLRSVEKVGHLILFLSGLARAAARNAPQAEQESERVHPAVHPMMRHLEEDLSRPWTVSDLAAQVCLEPSYCIRVFKQGTGMSPMAYLARCRAERAASLLLRTELPISEIGEHIGWADPNYFARRFRAHFGMSATDYRMQFSRSQPTG